MANQVRKITLTELNGIAGPNFSVQYSTDCITYSQSVDCTNAFLPSVGSVVYCTVDSDSTCIRLTSLSEACGNTVIENVNPITTTTTSTTTAAPTTTTTTLEPKDGRIFMIGMKTNKGFSQVIECSTEEQEREGIIKFFNTIDELKPSIIASYNGFNFDWFWIFEHDEDTG